MNGNDIRWMLMSPPCRLLITMSVVALLLGGCSGLAPRTEVPPLAASSAWPVACGHAGWRLSLYARLVRLRARDIEVARCPRAGALTAHANA
jgi:hypothetical protein